MANRRKSIAAGVYLGAVGLAGLMAVSHGITHYLMRVALDRQEPKYFRKTMEQLQGSSKIGELKEMLRESAETLTQKVTEEVRITAADGTRLVGHWWQSVPCKRVVIAMHGWRSAWCHDFGMIAEHWHNSGCSILFAEQRGQGESGGDYMGFGLTERCDCRDWAEWVNGKTEAFLPIYLGGVSMGATTVLMAAGLDLPSNVAGIVADSGFTSPHAIWKHVVEKNLHLPYRIRSAAADGLCQKKIHMRAKEYSTTEALAHTDIPVLFIHGSDDRFVPIEMTYENYKACASQKELLVVPGAGHAMSYLTDRTSYEKAMEAFWDKYDRNGVV